jgi:GTPase SAR1 family protein
MQTAGGDVYSKVIPFEKEGKDIELFLFDIGAQECYESIALPLVHAERMQLKNPDLVMLTYDCTNEETFKGAVKWLDKIKKNNSGKTYPGVLVATKCEHKNAKEVTTEEGREIAKKLGLEFFEVSASLKENIEQPFQYLAQKALTLSSYSIS